MEESKFSSKSDIITDPSTQYLTELLPTAILPPEAY